MGTKTNYDVLDKILADSQRDRTGNGGKVWVESAYHPDGGYWCDEGDTGKTWQTFKDQDEVERYLRS